MEQQPLFTKKTEPEQTPLQGFRKSNVLIASVIVMAAVMLGVLIAGACGVFPSGNTASSQEAVSVVPGTAASASSEAFASQLEKSAAVSVAGALSPSPSAQTSSAATGTDSSYALPAASSGQAPSSKAPASAAAASAANPNASAADESAPASSEPVPDSYSGPAISLTEFNALKEGMTYDDAVGVIGGGGTLTGQIGNVRVYEWKGYGSDGAFARISFKSGRLSSKYQFGL